MVKTARFDHWVLMDPHLRNFVIEGVACQLPRRLQATPLLQTSLAKTL